MSSPLRALRAALAPAGGMSCALRCVFATGLWQRGDLFLSVIQLLLRCELAKRLWQHMELIPGKIQFLQRCEFAKCLWQLNEALPDETKALLGGKALNICRIRGTQA